LFKSFFSSTSSLPKLFLYDLIWVAIQIPVFIVLVVIMFGSFLGLGIGGFFVLCCAIVPFLLVYYVIIEILNSYGVRFLIVGKYGVFDSIKEGFLLFKENIGFSIIWVILILIIRFFLMIIEFIILMFMIVPLFVLFFMIFGLGQVDPFSSTSTVIILAILLIVILIFFKMILSVIEAPIIVFIETFISKIFYGLRKEERKFIEEAEIIK